VSLLPSWRTGATDLRERSQIISVLGFDRHNNSDLHQRKVFTVRKTRTQQEVRCNGLNDNLTIDPGQILRTANAAAARH
jgi:hypothetical protein